MLSNICLKLIFCLALFLAPTSLQSAQQENHLEMLKKTVQPQIDAILKKYCTTTSSYRRGNIATFVGVLACLVLGANLFMQDWEAPLKRGLFIQAWENALQRGLRIDDFNVLPLNRPYFNQAERIIFRTTGALLMLSSFVVLFLGDKTSSLVSLTETTLDELKKNPLSVNANYLRMWFQDITMELERSKLLEAIPIFSDELHKAYTHAKTTISSPCIEGQEELHQARSTKAIALFALSIAKYLESLAPDTKTEPA